MATETQERRESEFFSVCFRRTWSSIRRFCWTRAVTFHLSTTSNSGSEWFPWLLLLSPLPVCVQAQMVLHFQSLHQDGRHAGQLRQQRSEANGVREQKASLIRGQQRSEVSRLLSEEPAPTAALRSVCFPHMMEDDQSSRPSGCSRRVCSVLLCTPSSLLI